MTKDDQQPEHSQVQRSSDPDSGGEARVINKGKRNSAFKLRANTIDPKLARDFHAGNQEKEALAARDTIADPPRAEPVDQDAAAPASKTTAPTPTAGSVTAPTPTSDADDTIVDPTEAERASEPTSPPASDDATPVPPITAADGAQDSQPRQSRAGWRVASVLLAVCVALVVLFFYVKRPTATDHPAETTVSPPAAAQTAKTAKPATTSPVRGAGSASTAAAVVPVTTSAEPKAPTPATAETPAPAIPNPPAPKKKAAPKPAAAPVAKPHVPSKAKPAPKPAPASSGASGKLPSGFNNKIPF